jgi:hypothetical protein
MPPRRKKESGGISSEINTTDTSSSASIAGVSPQIDAVSMDDESVFAANAERYVDNCKRFELKVDPSVVIALRTG